MRIASQSYDKIIRPILMVACIALSACAATPNSGDGGRQYVNSCSDSDLNSKSVLYFGPSNQIGPGSVWIRLGINGGYQPQWRMEDLGVDTTVVAPGLSFECSITATSQLTADAGLSVLSKVTTVSADVKSDFSHAKSIQVSSTKAAWDTLVAGPWSQRIDGLKNAAIRADVQGKNRLVLNRALKLSDYKAVLDFDTAVKPEIKAKYDGKLLSSTQVGEVGAQLTASWTQDGKLELTAKGDIYVAGEFAPLQDGKIVAGRGGSRVIEDLGDRNTNPYRAVK